MQQLRPPAAQPAPPRPLGQSRRAHGRAATAGRTDHRANAELLPTSARPNQPPHPHRGPGHTAALVLHEDQQPRRTLPAPHARPRDHRRTIRVTQAPVPRSSFRGGDQSAASPCTHLHNKGAAWTCSPISEQTAQALTWHTHRRSRPSHPSLIDFAGCTMAVRRSAISPLPIARIPLAHQILATDTRHRVRKLVPATDLLRRRQHPARPPQQDARTAPGQRHANHRQRQHPTDAPDHIHRQAVPLPLNGRRCRHPGAETGTRQAAARALMRSGRKPAQWSSPTTMTGACR